MYALVDGNNFYVSCERAFRPSLQGRPVVVLSNNDGCAIARSNDYVEWKLASRSLLPELQNRLSLNETGLPLPARSRPSNVTTKRPFQTGSDRSMLVHTDPL